MEVKILETTKEHYKVLVSVSPYDPKNPRKEGAKNSAVVAYMRNVMGHEDVIRARREPGVRVHNTAGTLEGEYTVYRDYAWPITGSGYGSTAKVVDTSKGVTTVKKRASSKSKKKPPSPPGAHSERYTKYAATNKEG